MRSKSAIHYFFKAITDFIVALYLNLQLKAKKKSFEPYPDLKLKNLTRNFKTTTVKVEAYELNLF